MGNQQSGGCKPPRGGGGSTWGAGDPSNGQCPFLAMQGKSDKRPQTLDLKILNPVNHGLTRAEYMVLFNKLDLLAVKTDIVAVLKDSKDWWPADWGHYGPFMVRLTWHQAGTYRTSDGRGGANGGNMRFNPLDSWPDNGNLDKARRLLWPIKQKYGESLSWADLLVFVGNVAMEDMGFKTFGFMGGRVDSWAREDDVYWGAPESFKGLAKCPGKLEKPLGAIVQSLIYVNPEGPDGIPDPLLAAAHIRETFARMAMNDEETVALIAGGHTFGKCHGAAPGGKHQGPPPSGAAIEEQGFGWTSSYKSGKGGDAITSGLEGAWTAKPTQWDHGYFTNLFKYEWVLARGSGGAWQWRPKDFKEVQTVPEAHDADKMTNPIMLTTDLSLKFDPEYEKISRRFLDNPDSFSDAYARAWYKLTHRDMGPARRGLGSMVAPEQIWQDPVSCGKDMGDVSGLKASAVAKLTEHGLTLGDLMCTAWASASTFRHTDYRGGANGGRLRLAPQNSWAVNKPVELAKILSHYEAVKKELKDEMSMADFIVLAGDGAVEAAVKKAGLNVTLETATGRGDATQEQTDVNSFAVLEPEADAFRNYNGTPSLLLDRAHLLGLSAKEMVLLVGGFRVMGVSGGSGLLGALCDKVGDKLDNSFFVNLLDMKYQWKKVSVGKVFEGSLREGDGAVVFRASGVDLCFGSNPELRAICEKYACEDAKGKFVEDFGKAWTKVMNLDRYDGKF